MLMQKCMVSAVNIFDLMEIKPTIVDRPGARVLERCQGRLDLEGVSFDYGTDKAAVADITLRIEAGKKYALVGASGAGKSTILSLIMRFYDPAQGVVRLDGFDVRDVAQHSLREHVGMVTQETFLFHDTIYENIRYGRLDATREQIVAAARSAFAHDFILAQPDGYETVVGDKGCMLSGGQQQRLAIARALLKNAPVLLLDEATSALDSESERMIQVALERLSEGRTVVAIAHRLSTILKSDCIVVMDHGRIVATGRHEELLQKSELYRSLYELQFHHNEGAV
jgi:subfamily B ATP-binding cassette protein MsbA